jgi:hypothetical protein
MTDTGRMQYRVWTSEEDAQLRKMAIAGTSSGEMAVALNRSKSAIQSRADKLGISLKIVNIHRPGK